MNAIFTITPRRYPNSPLWVFDDPSRGLIAEPFLHQASEVLDEIAKRIGAVDEMVIVFSGHPIPDATAIIKRAGVGDYVATNGVNYTFEGFRFWLCPATAKYLPDPPETIWIKAYKSSCS
jgi:hypothetical protein